MGRIRMLLRACILDEAISAQEHERGHASLCRRRCEARPRRPRARGCSSRRRSCGRPKTQTRDSADSDDGFASEMLREIKRDRNRETERVRAKETERRKRQREEERKREREREREQEAKNR